jgi:hypothetical protein
LHRRRYIAVVVDGKVQFYRAVELDHHPERQV